MIKGEIMETAHFGKFVLMIDELTPGEIGEKSS